MVEVFKTNVTKSSQAQILTTLIQKNFEGYKATFDLEDCDKIMRILCTGHVSPAAVITFMEDMGFKAAVLPDTLPTQSSFKVPLSNLSICSMMHLSTRK
ncbi:MAG TPA: hypothetical protein VL947_02705 [Cytophagales bacterium]|nr:hypothetical protein [Cytophagales bacterium]